MGRAGMGIWREWKKGIKRGLVLQLIHQIENLLTKLIFHFYFGIWTWGLRCERDFEGGRHSNGSFLSPFKGAKLWPCGSQRAIRNVHWHVGVKPNRWILFYFRFKEVKWSSKAKFAYFNWGKIIGLRNINKMVSSKCSKLNANFFFQKLKPFSDFWRLKRMKNKA